MSDKAIARQDHKIYIENQEVGYVTSGTFSYLLKSGIGIAFINREIDNYSNASVFIRNKNFNIEISRKALMKNTSLRK